MNKCITLVMIIFKIAMPVPLGNKKLKFLNLQGRSRFMLCLSTYGIESFMIGR